jgi:hypothetical protein
LRIFLTIVLTIAPAFEASAPLSAQGRLPGQDRAGSSQPAARGSQTVDLTQDARSHGLATIRGNALNATNGAVAGSLVRIRDVRIGRIVDTELTDKAGDFAFHGVNPGSYVIEVMGKDGTVVATSPIINVNAGDTVSTLVRLPSIGPSFAAALWQTTQTAASVIGVAASIGVLAAAPSTQCVSPPCR